ncbi:MAG: membrane dipeptidase [Arenicella sp.]|jgi:membrane dipeptidase
MIKKILKWALLLLVLIALMFFVFGPAQLEKGMNVVETHSDYPITEQAQELHDSLIIGDWHADSALWKRDLADYGARGHVDIPRLKKGNVALQMFTTVTKSPSGQNYEENETGARDNITSLALAQLWPSSTWSSLTSRAVYQAQKMHDLAQREPDSFRLIKSQSDLAQFIWDRQYNSTLVGGLIGTEGSHALDGKLDNIKLLFGNGFRMMSLQHFFDNKLGGSLHGVSQTGLTDFGRQAVLEMQALGIIIDVAHSSESVVQDVLQMSTRGLVVSHTGFKGYCDSPRNISDSLMRNIARKGGLIAVGYWEGAICGTSPAHIAGAIAYGIELVGADHVALGSDFDGSVTTSLDTSELVAITQALLDLGVATTDIRKVMGANMQQFLASQLPI